MAKVRYDDILGLVYYKILRSVIRNIRINRVFGESKCAKNFMFLLHTGLSF